MIVSRVIGGVRADQRLKASTMGFCGGADDASPDDEAPIPGMLLQRTCVHEGPGAAVSFVAMAITAVKTVCDNVGLCRSSTATTTVAVAFRARFAV